MQIGKLRFKMYPAGIFFYLFRFARIKIGLQLGVGKKEQFRNTESAVGGPPQITCYGTSIDTGLPFVERWEKPRSKNSNICLIFCIFRGLFAISLGLIQALLSNLFFLNIQWCTLPRNYWCTLCRNGSLGYL